MKKIYLLIAILVFFAVFRLFAQEETNAVYVIRKIEFAVEGRTAPSALLYYGEFAEGERIEGRESLEKYLAEKEQLLMNRRIHDEVSIGYTFDEPEEDGSIPVDLLVNVTDTWNFIVLPEPKYDSNEGFSLTLKARDYNFLGTMNPLRLDLGYLWSTKDESVFKLAIDSDTPFYAGGLRWNINFDHIFNYTVGEPLYYENISGISVELPAGFTTATVGIDQYLIINEENTQEYIERGFSDRFYNAYAATELYSSFKIPTGIAIGNYGELNYIPRVSGKIAYRPGGVDEPRRPSASLSQSIGLERINWIGNYRDGLDASIANINTFYFDPNDYRISINAGIIYHKRFLDWFGISTRLLYRHWFNGPNYEAASILRGFPNTSLRAENMLSLNLDLPFKALRFEPSKWFNSRKMRLLDFDLHLSPFVDIALTKGIYNESNETPFFGEAINFTDGLFGSGLEVIVFPDFFRSLYLRISAGYNMGRIIKTGDLPKWDELFIGIGHHY